MSLKAASARAAKHFNVAGPVLKCQPPRAVLPDWQSTRKVRPIPSSRHFSLDSRSGTRTIFISVGALARTSRIEKLRRKAGASLFSLAANNAAGFATNLVLHQQRSQCRFEGIGLPHKTQVGRV